MYIKLIHLDYKEKHLYSIIRRFKIQISKYCLDNSSLNKLITKFKQHLYD